MAMKFATNIQGPSYNLTDIGDPPTFHLVLPPSQNVHLFSILVNNQFPAKN